MSRRQRWTPVRGTESRIYEPWERLVGGAAALPGRRAVGPNRLVTGAPSLRHPASIREVLVLRLDRIGDVIMSLPALADLRAALPQARIRLAVGAWSVDAAKNAP